MAREFEPSEITPQLFLSSLPTDDNVAKVVELRISLVISMIFRQPARGLVAAGIDVMRLPTIDFPTFPIPMIKLHHGVTAALRFLDRGERVLVYCRWGRHRSVAMMGAILIAQGLTADQAMDLIAEKRPVADPRAFYIESRIRRFEHEWNAGIRR